MHAEDSKEKFVKDFVAAWTKVTEADRFDLPELRARGVARLSEGRIFGQERGRRGGFPRFCRQAVADSYFHAASEGTNSVGDKLRLKTRPGRSRILRIRGIERFTTRRRKKARPKPTRGCH